MNGNSSLSEQLQSLMHADPSLARVPILDGNSAQTVARFSQTASARHLPLDVDQLKEMLDTSQRLHTLIQQDTAIQQSLQAATSTDQMIDLVLSVAEREGIAVDGQQRDLLKKQLGGSRPSRDLSDAELEPVSGGVIASAIFGTIVVGVPLAAAGLVAAGVISMIVISTRKPT